MTFATNVPIAFEVQTIEFDVDKTLLSVNTAIMSDGSISFDTMNS